MKRILLLAAAAAALLISACNRYETVAGDPLDAKIYTLDNGLKVYMTVNKETPRIQTYIAVRSGGKNDPADNTGLAHYLEHIMFKGTEQVGTTDYTAEKPMLDQIQALYDVYRTKTDPAERAAIYHQIDSVSYEASKLAIPNEYDKMMALIGSEGSNAFTSSDVTCYQEDIPANQVENWAKVQSDRFKNMVVRGFHTELEAVYEEYNQGLTDDSEKAMIAIDSVLFPHHPYGTQTVIGTQEHLKNPDITAIKRQKELMYVPNNCAICLSGDFDPDQMIKVIKKYFGDWKATASVPALQYEPEQPITAPVEKHVLGYDAEFAMIGWRYPGVSDTDSEIAEIVGAILFNGQAGLMDLDLAQAQKLAEVEAFPYGRTDYGEMLLLGVPKEGQTLEEVRDLLLGEVARLRNGDFDAQLVEASLNNWKLAQMRQLQTNRNRAMQFVNSFIGGNTWAHDSRLQERLSALTKDDIVAWAKKYLGENSYVIAYKHIGQDPNIHKIEAPRITPIVTNRDLQSAFLQDIQNSEPKPIEPVFVDFDKDMQKLQDRGIEVLYKKNELNGIATLQYRFDLGSSSDPALEFALEYLSYLGTPQRSAEDIASELYRLACSYGASVSGDATVISFSGLGENMGDAVALVEDLAANAVGDEDILESLKTDALKNRADAKLNQRACNSALRAYVTYGPEYIRKTTLTDAQLKALTSDELLAKVRSLLGKQHRILYYGPQESAELSRTLAAVHHVPEKPEAVVRQRQPRLQTPEAKVIIAPYKARQFNYIQYSDRGESYDAEAQPAITLFNEYFGGGMNGIVFQEMRESRALAYSAGGSLSAPSFKEDSYAFAATIGSQNDKLKAAVTAFDEIITDMPASEKAFDIAKTAIISRLRTGRTTGIGVLNSYLNCEQLGITEPADRLVYAQVPGMTLTDLLDTKRQWIEDRTYVYGILGDPEDLDMDFLRSLGPVKTVSLEEIFGY